MFKLPSFKGVLSRAATTPTVSEEIERNSALLAGAREALGRLEADRTAVLLSDDLPAMKVHEASTADARLAVARLEARAEALEVQRNDIALREAGAALTARRKAVEARAEATARWFREVYPDLARQIVAALGDLDVAERDIIRVNDALVGAGRQDEVLPAIEPRFSPPEVSDCGEFVYQVPAWKLVLNTRLVAIEAIGAPGFGKSLEVPGHLWP